MASVKVIILLAERLGRSKQVLPVNAAPDQDPEEVLVHVAFQCYVFHKLCSSLEEPDRCGPQLSG